MSGDDQAPYADETVAIINATTYVISEDAAQILQLVVTKRQTTFVGAQSGGGIFGDIASLLVGVDGVQVDLHFEMCKDALKPGSPTHAATPKVLLAFVPSRSCGRGGSRGRICVNQSKSRRAGP